MYIAVFLGLAVLFASILILLPATLRRIRGVRIVPHNPNSIKSSTYECGMEPVGSAWVQFNIRYYFYAIVFVVIDILTVFIFPWAARLVEASGLSHSAALASVGAVAVFIFMVAIGYIYAWRKGILEWK